MIPTLSKNLSLLWGGEWISATTMDCWEAWLGEPSDVLLPGCIGLKADIGPGVGRLMST